VLCWIVLAMQRGTYSRLALVLASIGTAALISLLTPPLWTTWRPDWLPWPLESYINGVHNLGAPQAWLFPIFPWSAFAFAGLAVGFLLQTEWARQRDAFSFLAFAGAGLFFVGVAYWLDHGARQVYVVYDYWHTSPNFFLARIGMLLVILAASYTWCRWGAAVAGFSPLIQLGQASLLVYWVHIEFVYGRASILPKRSVSIRTASGGLLLIFLAMLLLAFLRTRMKGRGSELLALVRRPATAQ
jgi:surface polysaccharide O-acyltransferase-like enzyme